MSTQRSLTTGLHGDLLCEPTSPAETQGAIAVLHTYDEGGHTQEAMDRPSSEQLREWIDEVLA